MSIEYHKRNVGHPIFIPFYYVFSFSIIKPHLPCYRGWIVFLKSVKIKNLSSHNAFTKNILLLSFFFFLVIETFEWTTKKWNFWITKKFSYLTEFSLSSNTSVDDSQFFKAPKQPNSSRSDALLLIFLFNVIFRSSDMRYAMFEKKSFTPTLFLPIFPSFFWKFEFCKKKKFTKLEGNVIFVSMNFWKLFSFET